MKFLFNNIEKEGFVLNKGNKNTYYLIKSDEIEVKMLEVLLNETIIDNTNYPFINNIFMCGHKKEVRIGDCLEIIPIKKVHIEKGIYFNSKPMNVAEYKCYSENENKQKSTNVIQHEDRLSSFKCACEVKQIDWFVILKIKNNE